MGTGWWKELAPIDSQLPTQAHSSAFRVKREHLYLHVIPGSVFEIGFELKGCSFLEYSSALGSECEVRVHTDVQVL